MHFPRQVIEREREGETDRQTERAQVSRKLAQTIEKEMNC